MRAPAREQGRTTILFTILWSVRILCPDNLWKLINSLLLTLLLWYRLCVIIGLCFLWFICCFIFILEKIHKIRDCRLSLQRIIRVVWCLQHFCRNLMKLPHTDYCSWVFCVFQMDLPKDLWWMLKSKPDTFASLVQTHLLSLEFCCCLFAELNCSVLPLTSQWASLG